MFLFLRLLFTCARVLIYRCMFCAEDVNAPRCQTNDQNSLGQLKGFESPIGGTGETWVSKKTDCIYTVVLHSHGCTSKWMVYKGKYREHG